MSFSRLGQAASNVASSGTLNLRKLFIGGIAFVICIFIIPAVFMTVERVGASEFIVIQHVGGNISVHLKPGLAMQNLGTVTRYSQRGTIWFKADKREQTGQDGKTYTVYENDQRLPIVFNDAGTGKIMGSISYELPADENAMREIHRAYPSQQALETSLISTALKKSMNMTGALMTSYESYKERRPQLISFVEDQIVRGVYQTRTVEREVVDEFDPTQKKRVSLVEIVQQNGQPLRSETGQLERFKINAFNFAIEELDYDDRVKTQINRQQEITMGVQTSIAQAKQAEQDKLTAEARGLANVATARAEQEVSKTQAVVQAEKARDVAKLKADEAEWYKKERLTRADADAEANRKMLVSDGALDKKLGAWERVMGKWAEAYANAKNVPNVVMGGGNAGSNGAASAQQIMDMIGVKMAQDLEVSVKPKGQQ